MAVAALVVLVAGCDRGERRDGARRGPGSAEAAGPVTARAAEATTKTRCDVGGRPGYFVPKPEDSPIAIIGCARLGVSMKPVEFSANRERFRGRDDVCFNPAYQGRGQLGIYIPGTCVRTPLPRRLYVVRVEVPRQAVRGYRLVIWGTAAASTRRVTALYKGGETEAAVFTVRRPLARATGAARPFSVFVVELHREAACGHVILHAAGASSSGTSRVGPWRRLCRSDARARGRARR